MIELLKVQKMQQYSPTLLAISLQDDLVLTV